MWCVSVGDFKDGLIFLRWHDRFGARCRTRAHLKSWPRFFSVVVLQNVPTQLGLVWTIVRTRTNVGLEGMDRWCSHRRAGSQGNRWPQFSAACRDRFRFMEARPSLWRSEKFKWGWSFFVVFRDKLLAVILKGGNEFL